MESERPKQVMKEERVMQQIRKLSGFCPIGRSLYLFQKKMNVWLAWGAN